MSRNLICDGCGEKIREIDGGGPPYIVIEGHKLLTIIDQSQALARLPSEFHWCKDCANIACNAVRDAQKAAI